MNTVSIVTAVLNSHEIVRRQILHYKKMTLPPWVEIIFVDDGSDPSLESIYKKEGRFALNNFHIITTGHTAEWTQPTARNIGVKCASGDYVIVTDIDHIIPRNVIEGVCVFEGDVLRFKRQAGVLDEYGNFTQDDHELRRYGLLPKWKLNLPPHGNSFAIKKKLYLSVGGVSEKYFGTGRYPNREEVPLKRKLKQMKEAGEITICDDERRPRIYMIPNGRFCGDKDYNPFGLFHNLSRKNNKDLRHERGKQNAAVLP